MTPAVPERTPAEGGLLFVFDMDEVLYRYSWTERMAALTAITGLSLATLRERWWHADGELAAEAGRWTDGDDYLAAFTAAIDAEVTEAEWVAARGEAMTPLPDSLAAAARAAELGTVTLLTNNGALTQRHLPTLAPALPALFGDHLYTSSHYGARKPEPEVFTAVLERYGVPAERVFFADDLPENIAGARSVGITGHLFTGGVAMRNAIEEFAASHG